MLIKKSIPLFVCSLFILPISAFSFDDMGFAEVLSDDEISEYRGTSSNIDMQITFSENTSNNSITGANNIDGSAFNQASGLINIIQNSGNNVAIQAATDVTVTIN